MALEPRKGLKSVTTKYISKDEPNPHPTTVAYKGYTSLDDPANPVIYLTDRNSNTHIHELYHAWYSPQMSDSTTSSRIKEEINAELMVSDLKGKGLKLNSVRRIAYDAMKRGKASPNEVMTAIVNSLEEQGIVLDKSLRSELWQNLMQIKKGMYKK